MMTIPSIDLNVAALPVDVSAQGGTPPAEPSSSAVAAFQAALASSEPGDECPQTESGPAASAPMAEPVPVPVLVDENVAVAHDLEKMVVANAETLVRIAVETGMVTDRDAVTSVSQPVPVLVETNVAVAHDLSTAVGVNEEILTRIAANVPSFPGEAAEPRTETARSALASGEAVAVPQSVPVLVETNVAVGRDLATAVETNAATLSRIAAHVPPLAEGNVGLKSATVLPATSSNEAVAGGAGSVSVQGEVAATSQSVPVLVETNVAVGRELATVVAANAATLSKIAAFVPPTAEGTVVPHSVDVHAVPQTVAVETVSTAAEAAAVPQSVPVLVEANVSAARDLATAVEANTATLTRIAVAIPLETAVATNAELGRKLDAAQPLEMPVAMVGEVEEKTHEMTGAEAEIVAQAAPFVVPQMATPVQTESPEVRVQAVDVASVKAAALPPEQMLVEAAGAVAETLLVTPGLLSGQGEVVVQLRPDVLDGTEVRITVTGRDLQVVFEPRTVDMSVLIENCRPQLMEHLAARIHAFNVAVQVRPNVSAGAGARVRDEETV